MNREELAWAAGFFDGEGSFTHGGNTGPGSGRYAVVRITQTDAAVLHRFRRAVTSIGRVTGPHLTAHRPAFHYCAYGNEKSQAIGAMLWAFLSPPKRVQFKTRMAAAGWDGLTRSPDQRAKMSASLKQHHINRRAAQRLNHKEI